LRKGRIAAAHGWFNRIRQVAPMCQFTLLRGPTRFHNPNDISIGSAVFAGSQSCQADCRTDHATACVCNNRPHLRHSSLLRCGL